jgi:YD repeat-containing protein
MGKQRQSTYDGAGRLVQVVDAATNTTETYVWNADGTLASFPGPGYTRLLEYDEEGRLVRIRRDYGGGNVQLAYEYGYGFDGGRRWRKDYLNGVWTRYPCGVACGAGELVEQTSDLSGSQWTTSALYLQGISLVRRNNEWHHFDPLGTAQVITNSSAQVVSNNVYDVFGVLRYEQGSAQTPWRWRSLHVAEESFLGNNGLLVIPYRGVTSLVSLPGIGIGVGIGVVICLYQAWREVNRNDFGHGFNVDPGDLRHCFLCCRIVRCTLGLGPDFAFRLQLLWEIVQEIFFGNTFEDAFYDTMACVLGIRTGYMVTESCLTGCARNARALDWARRFYSPDLTPAHPSLY